MLVGATSGITIGTVLGIIAGNEPVMVASYAISGLIAGNILQTWKNRSYSWLYIRKCNINICSKW